MTENNSNDRRRDITGRIDTLGTGTNSVSGRRAAHRIGDRLSEQRSSDETDDSETTADASLADEEATEDDEADSDAAAVDEDDENDGPEIGSPEFDDDADDDSGEDTEFGDEETADGEDSSEAADEEDAHELETRAEGVDEHSSYEIELDPFVRAFAARRAVELGDESLDEYIVGSVKGYLAGLLGGEVSSPGTLEREVEVEADQIFGGLLETIADEDETVEDIVVDAVAEAYDVRVDEETLVVAGLRDHEALLNGVVANSSNDLNDVSEVVQAAVETRLIEEPA